jgi:hypothetical protein
MPLQATVRLAYRIPALAAPASRASRRPLLAMIAVASLVALLLGAMAGVVAASAKGAERARAEALHARLACDSLLAAQARWSCTQGLAPRRGGALPVRTTGTEGP